MEEEPFVDKHRLELIRRVTNVAPILEELLERDVINQVNYDKIRANHDSQDTMRALLSGPLESSGVRGKQIFYKILERNEPHLIDDLKRTESEPVMDVKVMDTVQVGSMMDKKLLIEILNDLSSEEFEKFKSLIELEKDFPLISRSRLDVADMQETVELMVEMNSQECVEVTKKVLKEMNRIDLVQRLSDISSRTKEKHLEHRPTLIQRVETMTSVIELLLETLADLSNRELKDFKKLLQSQSYPYKSYLEMLMMTDMQDTVFFVVQTFSQQSVKKTKDILNKMIKRDLVKRLSDSSSGPKKKHSVDEHLSALIHKVATKTAVRELLLETLNDLSDQELKTLKWLLQFTYFKKGLPCIPWIKLGPADRTEVVDLMVERCGQQSLEVIREVFMEMKRTDLVQRLSETSSGPKAAGSSVEAFGVKTTEGEKHSVDEQWPALIQKVETMTSVIELLLETLAGLSDGELEDFKKVIWSQSYHYKPCLEIPWMKPMKADMQDTVFIMVQTFGQQFVKKTKDILFQMNRRDLVKRLSDSSSGPKKKHSVDEHLSALIHKVATMGAVRELLLETLNDLSDQELKTLKWLLQLTHFKKDLPCIPLIHLEPADRTKVVDLMMERCGQQSVEVIREVFMEMKRTDLVQRLSETSSGPKAAGSSVEAFGVKTTEGEKHSVDEQWPALIQKVETMTSVIELLLETLADLSDGEHKDFKQVLLNHLRFTRQRFDIQWRLLDITDMQDTVFFIVQEYGQQSVEMMKKVLKDINRLSDSSSGPKKKHYVDEQISTLIQKVATMAAVKDMLLETLKDLSYQELKKFKEVLRWTVSQKDLPGISLRLSYTADREAIVDLMLQNCGQQSVNLMKKIFKKINRSDLVQRLSDTSSGPKEKQRSSLPQKDVSMTPVKEKLFETLEELRFWEFLQFKEVLQELRRQKHLPRVQIKRTYSTVDLVDLMVELYGQQSVKVTREVLKKMNRMDLVQSLSDTSSGSKGPSRSLEFEAHGRMMESSDWTKLEPEVNSTDADEDPTYSLQSEEGKFECRVSGLRWVCEEKVSIKYQFWSWEEHIERMESLQYMPAGPLLDIKLIAGKLNEVYLPHWICTDDSTILDKFAVLHIDACGDVVEDVSEVTSSHVKLSELIFSPRAVLMKVGFPVKIKCNMLIYYKTNTTFLQLHVYLIPHDPALQQRVNNKKFSKGYEIIEKPNPDKYLKMQQGFVLTADINTAKISPPKLTLRYDSQDPNFYEVFIENPDRNFNFTLSDHCTKKSEPVCEPVFESVWTCEIRKADYPKSGHLEAAASSTGPCCGATVRALGSSSGATGGNTLAEGRSTEEQSVDELSALVQKAATVTTIKEKLLKMLQRLREEKFEDFKWFLQDRDLIPAELPCIPQSKLEKADRKHVVDLMEQTYSQQAAEVTKMLFKKIDRNDLVKLL
ncbi:uncharacterized protein LOC121906043 isoform X1 [Thunnus maccoyii]|uniref:uncharacterized protein LOC121906043 isoform X1 n=1 Tax=Thunnus maccoyii TaxID=8240 RepID=UPI001C4BEDAE|nr:uncharacterized protein LOC121906043 isoform X1 [Thunnus maccoyii]XP_042280636.1 uncharacterized protein LOC121906043 isoform X1 [Thunnus maccoyii]